MHPTEADLDGWLAQAYSREQTADYSDIKLGPITALLRHLPPPPRPITFAGTKGKGSTLRFTEALLTAHGHHTIAFTSPHVRSVRERWRLDGELAPLAELHAAAATVEALEQKHQLALTYFERCFAIACILAAARPTAYFLCEVGLGGRLDCANALDARIAVLTHLSRDHCAILGNTLELIAREKLAIARPDAPLVIAPQSDAAASAIDASLPLASNIVRVEHGNRPTSLAGNHQQDNAATAIAASRLLIDLDEQRIEQALNSVHLAARCQVIQHGGRRILIDGAHNDASIAATIATAKQLLKPGWQLLLGVATDKDIDAICALIPNTISVTRVGYDGPRARREQQWPEAAQAWPWHDAITSALSAHQGDYDLCITGSFYLAGEALAVLAPEDTTPG